MTQNTEPTEQTQAPSAEQQVSPELVEAGFEIIRQAAKGYHVQKKAERLLAELEPKIDPLLIEAREIVKTTLTPERHRRCNCRDEIDMGKWDSGQKVRAALAALRRGMELAKREASC